MNHVYFCPRCGCSECATSGKKEAARLILDELTKRGALQTRNFTLTVSSSRFEEILTEVLTDKDNAAFLRHVI